MATLFHDLWQPVEKPRIRVKLLSPSPGNGGCLEYHRIDPDTP